MKTFILLLNAISVLSVLSCGSATTEPSPVSTTFIKIGEQTSEGTKVELFVNDTLKTGYNKLFVKLTSVSNNLVVKDAHVSIKPMMNMMAMSHSCPTEQPISSLISGDYFECASVFQMPTGAMGSWSVIVDIHNHISDKELTVTLPIAVIESHHCNVFTGSDSSKYIIAMVGASAFKMGLNNIEFTLYKIDSMSSYPPVESGTLDMSPDMPSMGHGSNGNVNPTHIGKGHYQGKVNFSMTGEWRITTDVSLGAVKIGTREMFVTIK